MAMPTSDVLDMRPEAQVCAAPMYLFGRNRTISGRIRTIRCFEDNALVKAAMAERSDGEVLVVDGQGSLRTALMGDQIAGTGCANGWAAAVIFGAIRDSAVIDGLQFHVKSLGMTPRKSAKAGTGDRDVIIEFGGMRFVPGAYLYSDPDGVVTVAESVGHELSRYRRQ